MKPFWNSCGRADHTCGIASLTVLTTPPLKEVPTDAIASACKDHYIGRKWLATFGRSSLAAKLAAVLPVTKQQRSGDLGEILAADYVNRKEWDYEVPVLRLRWKDGRDLAMRGDDVVGFKMKSNPIGLLKAEAKSRANITSAVLAEARTSLKKNKGRPAAFVIAFVVARLVEDGKRNLARTIEAQTAGVRLLDARELAHLLFIFCGNEPTALMEAQLTPVRSKGVQQIAVAVHCDKHQAMIKKVYTEAGGG